MKPIIGILAKRYRVEGLRDSLFLRDELKDSIIDNGGIAIGILPPDKVWTIGEYTEKSHNLTKQEQSDLIRQIKLCDGIILQGGTVSDGYEMFVSDYTFKHNIPTLGICAGQNNMVKSLGGTTKKVPNPEKHAQPLVDEVHKIFIDKTSKFYEIIKTKELIVNSRHKTIIDNPSEYYEVVATDDDGNIEVVENKTKKFNMAVRFHPESLYKTHNKHNAIIKAFVDACKK